MPFLSQRLLALARHPFSVGFRLRLLVGFVVFLTDFPVQRGEASNGDKHIVPMRRTIGPAFSKQSGLQILVDSTWAGTRGYRPLKVKAFMLQPATADTQITINFRAGHWRNDHRGISVEHNFELPQGATETTTTFSIPQYVDWGTYSWDIWVDGVKEEELCVEAASSNFGNSEGIAAGIFAKGQWSWNADPTQLLQSASRDGVESHDFDVSSLPDRWIDYSPLDVMVSTVRSLELLQARSPEKLRALLRWVRTGGNLWVLEVGQDFSELPELDKLLNPRQNDESATKDFPDSPLGHWRFLTFDGKGQPRLNDFIRLSMEESPERRAELSSLEIAESGNPDRAADSRRWFVARQYGLGTIVSFQSTRRLHRQDIESLATILQRSSLTENLDWETRHGNDPSSGNPNFNHLLIPDVGTAPVFEFQMLISLFVIGIGPVNYWLLKRRNQLPLLLITVPVAALAATLMLFTYGFLADGIGVRIRARSFTTLDQLAGEAASWARLSYFAGIAPSEGLELPTDTTIYPIHPARSNFNRLGRRLANQQRAVEWNREQRLTRGWLGTRTPTQYLSLTARPTNKSLLFEEQGDPFTVTNHLGTEVLALVVQDHKGNIFAGDQIAIDGSAKLLPSTYIKAASKLRKLLTENLPQLPAGYMENNRSQRGNYGVSMTDSLMEIQMEAMISPLATGWGNGTYLAVTATGIEVSLGLKGATETNSFHVVRGTW